MIEEKLVFIELLSASATQLRHDLERTRDEPLADELRERTLTLLEILLQAKVPYDWPLLCELLILMAPKMEQAGYRNEWVAYLERALFLSKEVDDLDGEAALGLQLGILYQVHSRWALAKQVLQSSGAIYQAQGKTPLYANVLNRLGYIARHQGELPQAEEYAYQALSLLQEEDSERHFSLFLLGVVAADTLQWKKAEAYYRHSLAICQQCGDTRNEARRHRDIGLALDGQDQLRPARNCYEQAIKMFEQIGDRVEAAATKMNLGIIYSKLGNPQTALDHYADAECVFRDVQDELHLGFVQLNQGVDYREIGRFAESEAKTSAAIEIMERLSRSALVALAQTNLGELYIECRRFAEADTQFQSALQSADQISDASLAKHHRTKIEDNLHKLLAESKANTD